MPIDVVKDRIAMQAPAHHVGQAADFMNVRGRKEHRAIGRGAKRTALLFMVLALALSWLFAVPAWILAVQAAVLACVATFILTRPDGPAGPQA